MAFSKFGFKTITHIGSAAGAAGTNRSLHAYVTNDDAAAVETSNYFNGISERVKVGDIIMVSLDMDGTPAGRNYVVSSNTAGVVAITPFEATAISSD